MTNPYNDGGKHIWDCGSYLTNCLIWNRDSATPVIQPGTNRIDKICLNGYAIIPIEEYDRLKNNCGEDFSFDQKTIDDFEEYLASKTTETKAEPS
jgi:hypothetical protein